MDLSEVVARPIARRGCCVTSPSYEEEDRSTVPDRTGQLWIIDCGDYSVHLVIGAPRNAGFNYSSKRWIHPTINLTSGSPQPIAEWTFESWGTRDGGSWTRIV